MLATKKSVVRGKYIGLVLILYGIAGFILASNTIDIRPGGLIDVTLPSPVVRPIYAIFNPVGLSLPYIAGGLPLEIWNPLVILVNYGYPIAMILIGVFIYFTPNIKMITRRT